MKKILTVMLVALLASALFGCTQNQKTSDYSGAENSNEKKRL